VKRLVLAVVILVLLASCSSGGHKSAAAGGATGLLSPSGSGSSSGAGSISGLTSSGTSGTSGASGASGSSASGLTSSGGSPSTIALTPQALATGGGLAGAESSTPPSIPAKNGNVTVGFFIVDTGQACSQYGAKCQGAADRPYVQAMVNWANAHGGAGGYHINPVYYEVNVLNGDFATQAAAACAALAEDDHAFISMGSWVDASPQFADCAAQHGMIDIDGSEYPFGDSDYSSLGQYLYQPGRIRPERWVPAYVNDLINRGFLTKGSKIGLVRLDIPIFGQIDTSIIKPILAAHGMSLTTDIAVSEPQGTDDIGALEAQSSSAVLHMKSAGVNRVIFLDASAYLTGAILEEGEAQSYDPPDGVASTQAPYAMIQNGLGPQFAGAVGISWLPGNDVDPAQDPGGVGAKVCAQVTDAAGLNGSTGRDIYCDTIFYLRAVLANHPPLTAAAFQAASNAVGSAALASSTYTTFFGPGIQDGPSTYRDTVYTASCNCFTYTGKISSFPT